MPELPEVECVRRTLEPKVKGRRVARVRTTLAKLARPQPRVFAAGLAGSRVLGTDRHGKLLILVLNDGAYWTIHLGMTGQVILADQRPEVKHIHISVSFDDGGPRLYFRDPRQFGGMTYCPDRAALEAGPLANMGPDALGIDRDVFVSRLAGRRARIKPLLLDQRVVAGIGNIYADESLHRAGIHPMSRPAELAEADLARLHGCLIETLGEALKMGGSSIANFVDAHGRPGAFQRVHRVYQRAGQACPACGSEVQRMVLGGRSTHFCEHCQSRGHSCRS